MAVITQRMTALIDRPVVVFLSGSSRLKECMHRFHGVATKHLHSYLGWRHMLERSGKELNPKLCLVQCSGVSNAQQLIHT